MVEYLIRLDDTFFIGALRRHRRLQPGRGVFSVVKACAAGLLGVACLSSAAQGRLSTALMRCSLIVALLTSQQIDYWIAGRRFRSSPYRGVTVRVTVNAEGVHWGAGSHDTKLRWVAYTRATMLPDGIMLYQGPDVFQWLPDAALVAGHRQDVEQVIQSHVRGASQCDSSDPRPQGSIRG